MARNDHDPKALEDTTVAATNSSTVMEKPALAEPHAGTKNDVAMVDDPSLELKFKEDKLRQQYIELLERRIRSLEAELHRGRRKSMSRERDERLSPPPDEMNIVQIPSDMQVSGRVVYEDVKFNEETRQWEATRIAAEPSADESKSQKDATHAFIWKIMHSQHDPEHKYSAVEVTGSKLENLLRAELSDLPGHLNDDRLSFDYSFDKIIHKWDRLTEIAEYGRGYNSEAVEDLNLFLNHIKRSIDLKNYLDKRDGNMKNRVIAFEDLWTVFPPGELVFAEPFGEPQLFVVRDIHERIVETHNFFAVDCWSYGMLSPYLKDRR